MLEKIYDGRVGKTIETQQLPTNVGNSRHDRETTSLVAKDFGISGRTYERYKETYTYGKDIINPANYLKNSLFYAVMKLWQLITKYKYSIILALVILWLLFLVMPGFNKRQVLYSLTMSGS